jgi:hypothetical protein
MLLSSNFSESGQWTKSKTPVILVDSIVCIILLLSRSHRSHDPNTFLAEKEIGKYIGFDWKLRTYQKKRLPVSPAMRSLGETGRDTLLLRSHCYELLQMIAGRP